MSQRELFIDQNNLEENNFKSFVDAEYSREINKRRIIIKMGISRGELKKKKKPLTGSRFRPNLEAVSMMTGESII